MCMCVRGAGGSQQESTVWGAVKKETIQCRQLGLTQSMAVVQLDSVAAQLWNQRGCEVVLGRSGLGVRPPSTVAARLCVLKFEPS